MYLRRKVYSLNGYDFDERLYATRLGEGGKFYNENGEIVGSLKGSKDAFTEKELKSAKRGKDFKNNYDVWGNKAGKKASVYDTTHERHLENIKTSNKLNKEIAVSKEAAIKSYMSKHPGVSRQEAEVMVAKMMREDGLGKVKDQIKKRLEESAAKKNAVEQAAATAEEGLMAKFKGLSRNKKAAIIGGAVAGTAGLGYGGYKLTQKEHSYLDGFTEGYYEALFSAYDDENLYY